ncbi:MAG: hypothetical protein JSV70_09050 [bacterium]|nr:MAG: hypothetical protein JSV70_09050 [bacterium]
MAISQEVRQRAQRFGVGGFVKHWYHENGMPGWTRSWHGYPCLHMFEMGFMPPYDSKQELDLLRVEAGELEVTLGEIRKRIRELETSGS